VNKKIDNFKNLVGENWVITDSDTLKSYLEDETPQGSKVKPVSDIIVVKPGESEELSKVMREANRRNIPVFVRGGGTGLVGGCVPTKKGIVVSMDRFKDIKVNDESLTATVGAGVTLEELKASVNKAKLSFPPHPGDETAQIGGLVSCDAGGASVVKTGTMRNFVMGLEIVLPTGETIRTGGRLVRDNVNAGKLMNFFIGTEGIFGIITEITLKLQKSQKARGIMIAPFDKKHNSLEVVPKILKSELTPEGIEYAERKTIELVSEVGREISPFEGGEAFLLLMFSEPNEEALYSGLEKLRKTLKKFGAKEPYFAETESEREKIMGIRSEFYPSLKPEMYKDLDICVPVDKTRDFISKLDEISKEYETYLHPYGHVGDGNLHVHIMQSENWSEEKYSSLEEDIYRTGTELGGTISGEHGVGEVKKKFLYLNLDKKSRILLKSLKKTLDPKNILNPGKVID